MIDTIETLEREAAELLHAWQIQAPNAELRQRIAELHARIKRMRVALDEQEGAK